MFQSFCLFPEPAAACSSAFGGRSCIEVPQSGRSFLMVREDGVPKVSSDVSSVAAACAILEPVRYERRLFLAMLSKPSSGLRLNGLPPAAVSILRAGDQIALDPSHLLHVSVFTRPYLGVPRAEHVGKVCPVCLTAIEPPPPDAASIIYACPSCAAVLHVRSPLQGEDAPLECMKLSASCPSCGNRIVKEEGFEFVPDI